MKLLFGSISFSSEPSLACALILIAATSGCAEKATDLAGSSAGAHDQVDSARLGDMLNSDDPEVIVKALHAFADLPTEDVLPFTTELASLMGSKAQIEREGRPIGVGRLAASTLARCVPTCFPLILASLRSSSGLEVDNALASLQIVVSSDEGVDESVFGPEIQRQILHELERLSSDPTNLPRARSAARLSSWMREDSP